MLYVSNIIKDSDSIEITDTATNEVFIEPVSTLYAKYNKKVVEGLTFSPKRKQPRIVITTPMMLMLNRIPIGQVVLINRKKNATGFEHCIKIKQDRNAYAFYSGGKLGFFVLPKSILINYKENFALDVSHIDVNVANLLKKEYKEYLQNKKK